MGASYSLEFMSFSFKGCLYQSDPQEEQKSARMILPHDHTLRVALLGLMRIKQPEVEHRVEIRGFLKLA